MAASGSVVLVSTMHWCAVNSRCLEQKLLLHLHTMVCSTKLNFFLQWAHLGFFGMVVLYLILSREKKNTYLQLGNFFSLEYIKKTPTMSKTKIILILVLLALSMLYVLTPTNLTGSNENC
mgnify:CR=1 FL=1